MRISPALLSDIALRAIVLEFVTRDGTDYSAIDRRVDEVLAQLATGAVEINFNRESRSCNIVPVT
jgi:uncharacterized protein